MGLEATERERPELRVYPACCTSAYCGRIECTGCPNLPVLNEFKAWRDRTAAVVTDEVWTPLVYTATKEP